MDNDTEKDKEVRKKIETQIPLGGNKNAKPKRYLESDGPCPRHPATAGMCVPGQCKAGQQRRQTHGNRKLYGCGPVL